MRELLGEHLPAWAATLATAGVAAGLVLGFVGVSALMYIWAERKVSARMQDRLGPTRTGPYGLLQSLADGVKLLTKEDLTPDAADKLLFHAAPYVAFCASFAGFIALPFGLGVAAQSVGVGAFFMLAALSSEVFGVLLAGYASGSKWALFGGVREAAQVVSYEVPRSLCVLVPVCVTGTLDLSAIGAQQAGGFWGWNLFHDPFTMAAFVVFFVTATASCKRAPFDLAEAESELVGGFHTEYSGLRWSFFFLAEYASMFAVSGLAVLLFLGGWHTGLLPGEPTELLGPWLGHPLNAAVFIAKGSGLVLVMMWLRWSLPRLRIDQVMETCLKYFLPIACGLLLGVCVWRLVMPAGLGQAVRYALAGGTVLALAAVALKLARHRDATPRGGLAGVWAEPVGGRR